MMHFERRQIDELDRIYRINLINSCSGYKSANLLGTKSAEGQSNLAVFSSVIHMGSSPPLLGFVLRPTKVARHTYSNIKETDVYTINHVGYDFAEKAHHTSAKYEEQVSEFDAAGLLEEFKNDFHAPFVKGSPVQMAMKYVEEHYVSSNGTLLVIGEMLDLYLRDDLLEEDGFVNLAKGRVASICGLDGYTVPADPVRFGYQRPKQANNPETARENEWSIF